MKFIDKFNRALLKSEPKIQDWNAGAFRSVELKFSFTREGKHHHYKLVVEKSHPKMEAFGYSKNSVKLFRYDTKSMLCGYSCELPNGMVDLSYIEQLTTQTDDEIEVVVSRYKYAIGEFNNEFLRAD